MKKTILERNLEAWEQRFPENSVEINKKWNEYQNKKNKELQILPQVSGDESIILKVCQKGRELFLGGKRGNKTLIDLWLEGLEEIQPFTFFYIVGLGNPEYIKALDEKYDKNVQILIYEPCIDIFYNVLENIDISTILKSERTILFFVDGINDKLIDYSLGQLITAENFSYIKTFILPNYEKLFATKTLNFVKMVRRKCDTEKVGINTSIRFANVNAENILCNAKYVIKGYKTRQFVDVIPRDIPAIIVAAGPSLNKNILELKKAKGRAFIIAVDTAIKPLLNAGIIPDMYAVVDGKKPLHLVQIDGAEKIPLLTSVSASHALLDYHKGMKVFYNEGYPIINKMFEINGKSFETVPCGGSVATSAFAFAYMIGLNRIILVGQDLALTGNKTHADGTFEEKANEIDTSGAIMVEGNEEKLVPTRSDFKIYLDWYNYFIKGCLDAGVDLHVINATEGGAKIDNAKIMRLKDAITQECTKEVNIQECMKKMPTVFDMTEQERASQYLKKIPEGLHSIKITANELEKTYKKLQKITTAGNMDLRAYRKVLCRIKKLTKQVEKNKECYELISDSLKVADYILKSEQHLKVNSYEEEGKEIARQGLLYTQLLKQCAGLLEDLAEEQLKI